jgi:protein phosphatase
VTRPVASAGDTHVGNVRTSNEDALIVERAHGLFVVLDGMGGANAGDIAAQTARDAIGAFVAEHRGALEPRPLLEAAIQAGSAAVFAAAANRRERHGMGTTCVACLLVDPQHAVIGHVGDSRAYLLRDGRLQCLTRDHTIVEELVLRGLLSPEDAERHPHNSVLSRNLGATAETRVDLLDLELKPGDRVLLCSDGLYGYASAEGIQYVLGSGDAPEHVAHELIELALRGGGGDNVTAIVIETPAQLATSTQLVRTNGAIAWWQQRPRFLEVARERGLTKNPIVRGVEPAEALELIGVSVCEAIYHDLEKSSGVNVWTFAQTLGSGWFGRGGDWASLRAMMDILGSSARTVVDELRAGDPELGFLLDVAVSRALVVAELSLGGLLAERLRQADHELILLHTATTAPVAAADPDDASDRFVERPTTPFVRPDRPITSSSESAEVVTAIANTLTIARAGSASRGELVAHVLSAIEATAADGDGAFPTAVIAARDLYGIRTIDEAGIMPLFEALDHARVLVTAAVHQIQASEPVRARALRVISTAHLRLVAATSALVLEATTPYADHLRLVQARTAELRERVAAAERTRAELERRLAGTIDPSLPWGSRGTTGW